VVGSTCGRTNSRSRLTSIGASLRIPRPGASIVDMRDPAFSWPVFEDAARGVSAHYKTVDALSMVGCSRLPPQARHMDADVDRIIDAVNAELS